MTFIKTNFKRKYTKRKYTKRKYTKRKYTKRKYTKQKSKKHGGKFTNNPPYMAKQKAILDYIKKYNSDVQDSDLQPFFKILENSEDEFDLDNILKNLKLAVVSGRKQKPPQNRNNKYICLS